MNDDRKPGPALSIAALQAKLESHGFACRAHVRADAVVSGVTHDSRAVAAGDLFLAMSGTRTDGARYIEQALAAGAVAVVCEPGVAAADVARIELDDVMRAAGVIASAVHGEPTAGMRVVGITGTNGKTSCTYLLESVLAAAGHSAGVVGTVSQRWPGHESTASMTTPPATDLQKMMAQVAAAGCGWVAMEVSSHALSQHRVAGCSFDAAIFTNLTRDHLDYHGDEETYFAAKARLFLEYLSPDGVAVLNADDAFAMRLVDTLGRDRCRTFSIEPGVDADVVVTALDSDLDGLRGRLRLGTGGREIELDSRLVGTPNLANIAAVVAAADALGLATDSIERGLRACAPVPGRVERIGRTRPVVLVDYAHTPDALERTLASVARHTVGRLIVVFGCGGDRDRGKRPMMGEIAGREATVAVLTSDNPRSEEPAAILADIEVGVTRVSGMTRARDVEALRAPGAGGYLVEADRERAIAAALALAATDDVVVVAGKGHEDYQDVAGHKRHFDDREVVRRLQGGGHGGDVSGDEADDGTVRPC